MTHDDSGSYRSARAAADRAQESESFFDELPPIDEPTSADGQPKKRRRRRGGRGRRKSGDRPAEPTSQADAPSSEPTSEPTSGSRASDERLPERRRSQTSQAAQEGRSPPPQRSAERPPREGGDRSRRRSRDERRPERRPERRDEVYDEADDRRDADEHDQFERVEVDHTHKTFSGGFSTLGLSQLTMRALAAAGYEEPTPIQAGLVPRALAGVDVLGQARTGTGKTASFVIPILEKLEPHHAHAHPQALVLVPTRELAVQVKDEFEKLARGRKAHILAVYGGKPIRGQVERLQRGVDVVVGTPGRVLDHMSRGTLVLDNLKLSVLDEADRMLDIGFLPDIEKILRRCPQSRQTLLLSATVPPPIEKLARRFMRDPETQNFSPQNISADTIEQFYFTVDADKKFELLVRLLDREQPKQSIIFCRTKRGVEKIHTHLQKKISGTSCIHGDLAQSARDRVMKSFREGGVQHLVATDVVGRGIDVSGISHIINYDVPAFCDDYVHRVGRTGRMGREGVAFTFVTPEEGNELTRIEIRIEKLLKRDEIEGFEASRKRGISDVERAVAAAEQSSTKYITDDTGVSASQPPSGDGPPKPPAKKKYRRAL